MTRLLPQLVVAGAMALAAAETAQSQSTGQLSARDVMERNFFVTKVASLHVDLTMSLINDRGQRRERRTTTVIKLQPNGVDSKFLVRFSEPPDVSGTGLLQIEHSDGDDDLWIYLPALRKARRLVASNKKDSFVGSDFSYGDIALPKVDQYRHVLRSTEQVDGATCYVIESTPATDAVRSNSGYSRKITWVRADNFLETKVEYYDLANRHLKTQRVSRHEPVASQAGKWFALEREMTNHQTGHRTLLIATRVDGKAPVSDNVFTTRVLERP
jgi:hypothetical protein